MDYDAIIIGAGLGGLTAGAKLARSGKKVLLIEQHTIPGGCATHFKRKDFTIEVSLHEMDGLDAIDLKTKIFEDLDIFKHVELIRLPEFYRYTKAEIDFVMPDDSSRAIRALTERFPEERKGIADYFRTIGGIRKELSQLPRSRLWQILSLPIFPLLFPLITQYANKALGDFLDETIDDEQLKLLLIANLGYYHDDPYSMAMLYFSIAQDAYYAGGWYVRGGSQKLSDYLAASITSTGGKILYRHMVEEIIVEKRRAVGVKYRKKGKKNDGLLTARAGHILANNAVPNLTEMLPERESKKLKKSISELKRSCSIITLYLGFSKPAKELGNKHYSTFIANPKVNSLKDFAEDLKHSPYDKRGLIFVDHSQIDSGLAPEGKSLGLLATTDYAENWEGLSRIAYKKKKEAVSQQMIEKLESLIPGIKDHIEYYELSTAKTIERYTLNPGGATYGFAQTTEQSGNKRYGQKSPIKNLHIASAWGFPGGGFSGAIIGGYLASLKVKT